MTDEPKTPRKKAITFIPPKPGEPQGADGLPPPPKWATDTGEINLKEAIPEDDAEEIGVAELEEVTPAEPPPPVPVRVPVKLSPKTRATLDAASFRVKQRYVAGQPPPLPTPAPQKLTPEEEQIQLAQAEARRNEALRAGSHPTALRDLLHPPTSRFARPTGPPEDGHTDRIHRHVNRAVADARHEEWAEDEAHLEPTPDAPPPLGVWDRMRLLRFPTIAAVIPWRKKPVPDSEEVLEPNPRLTNRRFRIGFTVFVLLVLVGVGYVVYVSVFPEERETVAEVTPTAAPTTAEAPQQPVASAPPSPAAPAPAPSPPASPPPAAVSTTPTAPALPSAPTPSVEEKPQVAEAPQAPPPPVAPPKEEIILVPKPVPPPVEAKPVPPKPEEKKEVAQAPPTPQPAAVGACVGNQVLCAEGLTACLARVTALHGPAAAKGSCGWRCGEPCFPAPTSDPTDTPSAPPTLVAAEPAPESVDLCPEGKAACTARVTPLYGAAAARGRCGLCTRP